MEVALALLADAGNISQEGKLNVLGAFNIVFVPQFPGSIPRCCLILRFEAAVEEKGTQQQIELRFVDPDGRVLFSFSSRLIVPADGPAGPVTLDAVIGVDGITFHGAGQHRIEISIDGQNKRNVEISVATVQGLPGHGNAE